LNEAFVWLRAWLTSSRIFAQTSSFDEVKLRMQLVAVNEEVCTAAKFMVKMRRNSVRGSSSPGRSSLLACRISQARKSSCWEAVA